MMYEKRVKEWLDSLEKPCTIELRYRDGEIIDSCLLTDESDTETVTAEFLESAKADADDANKTRIYTLVCIDSTGQRWVMPGRLKQTIERANHEMYRETAKHNVELMKMLMQERKDDRRLLLELTESLGRQLKREQDVNDRYRQRGQEYFDKWEEVQSKHLERKLEIERHEQNQELKERFADILVPLLVAAAAKYTGNALPLPPANTKELAVREIAKAMQEQQLDVLQAILGQRWGDFKAMLDAALDGQVNLTHFRAFANSLPQETQMAVIQSLNPGQQAAIQVVLADENS